MRRLFAIGLCLLILAPAAIAKEEECKGQGNRLFYARCVNKKLSKLPLVRSIRPDITETECSGKTGRDFIGCMKVLERLRRLKHLEIDDACDNFKGMEKRLCEANGGPTGTGRVLRTDVERVVPKWKSTRKKYEKPLRTE